ncbi:hypothetical protein BKA82DRAFT_22495 [Pisolithus tinctorius]|uniref:Uncharacterized protein n=1 Tax=Pisolithus tinctorius Marx 270 TaxID=870435 RepID=A0A0C3PKA3_PISTI|nr:hypothetical protein BKA82DRAFT_22495 [Pisolithus tinctorius]KIO08654.1 hypothetical protein M404DRAFT_22495 [Pisolithus tinctorius Marx 270]
MSGREEDEASSSRRDGKQSKVLDRVEVQSLISEGKEDGTSSWVECEELLTKLRKGKFEAKVPFSVLVRTLSTARYRYPGAKEEAIDSDGQLEAVRQLLSPRLRPPDGEMEGQQSTLSEVSACTCQGRRPIFEAGSKIYRSKVTCFVMIRACTTLQYSVPRVEKSKSFGRQTGTR